VNGISKFGTARQPGFKVRQRPNLFLEALRRLFLLTRRLRKPLHECRLWLYDGCLDNYRPVFRMILGGQRYPEVPRAEE
jgi:hypothetical protein